ncbi:WD40-repeat-containing domain protein [Halteromyces radiatus]|uniref:WD40-repeat-containing domain protein n=1 Tax=Halteromyces radiatus TaxID=101107 RepID=UPI00221E8C80|nr:WD40-repeat-containing domain protein [Halteromyces radiatus]KAI8081634.1 WD40-repeat-containing domain protein [Halteromyces radiatus]
MNRQHSTQKDVYQYNCPWPMYALDWCKTRDERNSFRLAVGSFIEDNNNKLQIIARTDLLHEQQQRQQQSNSDFTAVAEADSYYPITKVLWEPSQTEAKNTDLIATAGDILRIWELVDNPHYGTSSNSINGNNGDRKSPTYFTQRLIKKAELVNMKQTDFCAPLTSFDWNETDPSLVVTSSIDTTCTVWNVETNQAKTQLIAHDSDVYDVGFMHGSADIFASVGADGSVRLFDLRSLEHSTILYESPIPSSTTRSSNLQTGSCPLLRLQFNRMNPNLLATFHMDSTSVQILDIRHPSAPVAELVKCHQSNVNCLNWSPTQSGQIATGGDDTQVLIWNIHDSDQTSPSYQSQQSLSKNQPPLRTIQDPILAYTAESGINSLSWSKSSPQWVGIGFGKTIQALHV